MIAILPETQQTLPETRFLQETGFLSGTQQTGFLSGTQQGAKGETNN